MKPSAYVAAFLEWPAGAGDPFVRLAAAPVEAFHGLPSGVERLQGIAGGHEQGAAFAAAATRRVFA